MTMLNDSQSMGAAVGAVARKAVYTVTERNDRSWWTKIGVAFVNKDGSLTVRLDATPISGVLQIRDEDATRTPRMGGHQ
ncbi:MAG: hypothetical protein Q8Q09_07830 [Deltaproteobacteria bacterium]|nr:hypothetical protein [Deltaproteobacteria bacterium]